MNRYLIFFIHSSVNGHLGCLHTLTVVNKAAINIEDMYLFELVFLFFSGIYPEVKLLDMVILLLAF